MDTGQAGGISNVGRVGSGREEAAGEGEDPPVIDTTSAEVERKADGEKAREGCTKSTTCRCQKGDMQ